MPWIKPQKKLLKRACAYRACGQRFQPKKENQIYCSSTHKVYEFNERKFDAAVEAEVLERLKRRAAEAESGS